MWKKIRQWIFSGDNSININAGRDIILNNAPTQLVDQIIDEEVKRLRKSRFFSDFDRGRSSMALGKRLVDGDLSGGSNELRSRGLAWCARILSRTEEFDQGDTFLTIAKTLGDSPEIRIAEAFTLSRTKDRSAALQVLADIGSSTSCSASLVIVDHHVGNDGALQWMDDAGYTADDLDADGKTSLLTIQLNLGYWDASTETVLTVSELDLEESPILHHLVGIARLITAVPVDLRAVVLAQPPFNARNFPLAADTVALVVRRSAQKHFVKAAEAAKRLGCPRSARAADGYALWLELRDPTQAALGKDRLEKMLCDPDSRLGVVNYALEFDIRLDVDAVERDIDRSIAKNGSMTKDAAVARLALSFTKPTPEERANYIARHYDLLAVHIDPVLIQVQQVHMFSRAGMISKANEILCQLIEQGISPEMERRLRLTISESEGNDPVGPRKAQYEATDALGDLIVLCEALEEYWHWEGLCHYGMLLFERTRSVDNAERLVNAYTNTNRTMAIVEFLKENLDLLSQSRNLQMSHAWSLYHEGALLESRAALAKLRDDSEDPNYRALWVNLGITMGDLSILSSYVLDEYQKKDKRSAQDMMRVAQLALYLELPHAKSLVFEAAEKAGDDASMLASAYFLATGAGWEDDPQVFQWLARAEELSGDSGPLQKMSFKDFLDRKPDWDRRESEIWRALEAGQIPIFIAAESLNRSLIDLTTFPALSNLYERDPRSRNVIPSYSGARAPRQFKVNGKTVGLDATALLTLSFLEILDVTLDAFETVYIPHSTLEWLFAERQKAAFHQPSRIKNAHLIRELLAINKLEKFVPSTVADGELSAQVGDELASLIAEAEIVRGDDDTQHIVVRSSPVYRISSFMEEEADLSTFAAILSSCLPVVEKLRQKGQVTADEAKRAHAYLQLHEKPWPNQPEIADGATLYLDDLAISYFLRLGLLGKLENAGFRAVVSPRKVSEANDLLCYERISDDVKSVIERIRSSLNMRIESGHVRVSRQSGIGRAAESELSQHPTVGAIGLTAHCDALITDDRFVNQHANIEDGDSLTPVLSTLDLLDALVVADVISNDDCLEYRTRLRRAGYFFVPVNPDELCRCLKASAFADGNVNETAELKAIRESVSDKTRAYRFF